MTQSLIVTWLALFVLNLSVRFLPLLGMKWLEKQAWMKTIAARLPVMILVLLVIHNLEPRIIPFGSSSYVTFLGLGATLLTHWWKRQPIFSIAMGVVVYSVAHWLLG